VLEIEEIIRPADQGRTTPFLCNASDGNAYYVKGYAASVAGLMKEWLGAYLAQAFKSVLINKQYDAVEKLDKESFWRTMRECVINPDFLKVLFGNTYSAAVFGVKSRFLNH
jgi:hypothetical protein